MAWVPIMAATPEWRVVGQVGGPTVSVAIRGQYAYLGSGSRVVVVDISDRRNLREAGSSARLPHRVEDVALSGRYAYVAAGAAGLRILDISDPARPAEVGAWTSPGVARGVAVSGSYAYLADGPFGLRILDVSNPAQPREAGSAFVLLDARKVRVESGRAYVAAAGAGLLIADVSNPARPTELAPLRVPGYAYDVAVGGGWAYVAAGWEGLQVVSVADAARPALAGALPLPGWAFGVALASPTLFVADTLKGLRSVDVSDPRRPAETGRLEWNSALATAVAVADDTVFVADAQWGLHAIDVANPAQPARAGFYGAMAHADHVVVEGDLAYVAAGYGGFRVMDVSDPTRPRELGTYGDGRSYFTGVWVERNIAYTVSILGPGNALYTLDVSDPSRPRRLAEFHASGGQVHDVVVIGKIAYLTSEYELEVVDVSDPSHPVEVYRLPLSTEYGSFDCRMVVSGTRAYVALHGVMILDLSNPLRPTVAGHYRGHDIVAGLAVRGNLLYISDGGALFAVDVSNPANPVETARFSGPGFPAGVVVLGNRLYAASGNAGLQVYDLSNPRLPAFMATAKTMGNAHELAVQGGLVYVADESGGLTVLQEGQNGVVAPARSRWAGLFPQAAAPDLLPPSPQRSRNGAVCLVTSTEDAGAGTLRECLGKVQYGDTITFDAAVFPPSQPATIRLETALPRVQRGGLTIDASDAGVVLDGSRTPPGTPGLVLRSEDNVVRGLQVVRFPGIGIQVLGKRNTIGGDRARGRAPLGQGNLLSGNGYQGLRFDESGDDSVASGNFIGTTLDGRSAWPNGAGIFIDWGKNNLFHDNLIGGNKGFGVVVVNWGAAFNSFTGNLIGTDVSGTAALGNWIGIATGSGAWGFTRIGGTQPRERNVISGNQGWGVQVGAGFGNLVLGNYIGVDARGSSLLTNRDLGILNFMSARSTVIGGATEGERNVIGLDRGTGISIDSDFSLIAGNTIGTDATLSAALGGGTGISVNHAAHAIVQRNAIANNRFGVSATGADFVTLRQNTTWRNHGLGIALNQSNQAISAPQVASSSRTSVSGRACAGCTVEVFSDEGAEGRYLEGETVADTSGVFAFSKPAGFAAPNLALTATDRAGNTSPYSTCVQRLSASLTEVPASGGSGRAAIAAPAGCGWALSGGVEWIKAGAGVGSGELAYTVAANTSIAPRQAYLSAGGQFVALRQAGAASTRPLPTIAAVVNAASSAPGASPGAWLSIYGENLAPMTRGWTGSDFSGARLPRELDGVVVYVNGRPGAISYLSPKQVNVLAPDDTVEAAVPVQVVTPEGASAPFLANLARSAPGLFTFGGRYVAAVHANGDYAVSPAVLPGSPARAARPGDVIQVFGTGFGPTAPPVPALYLLSGAAALKSWPVVRIGDVSAEVRYAGRIGPGLDQINIAVPALPAGDHPVRAEIEGRATGQPVFLTIQEHN